MSKPLFGLILGGILGVFDGLTAWFTPEARNELLGIIVGSTFKGLVAGVAIGYFAKKVDSLPLGVVFGLGVGLVLAWIGAALGDREALLLRDHASRRDRRSDRRLRDAEVPGDTTSASLIELTSRLTA